MERSLIDAKQGFGGVATFCFVMREKVMTVTLPESP
jgi:hypothetical protein